MLQKPINLDADDRENLEQGIEQGIILGMISAFRDLQISDDIITKKLQDKFGITEKEARTYLKTAAQR